jgi:uncharacterized membrane protein
LVSSVVYFNSGDDPYVLLPTVSPQVLRAYDLSGDLAYTLNGSSVAVSAREKSAGYSLTLEYFTASLTSKNGSLWSVNYVAGMADDVRDCIVTLRLPANSTITSVTPQGVISTEDGLLQVEWYMASIKAGNNASVRVEYTTGAAPKTPVVQTTLPQETETQRTQGGRIKIIILLITLILVSSAVIHHSLKKRKTPSPPQNTVPLSKGKEDIMETLAKNEREIIAELLNSGGKTTQAELFRATGIPKATLSRSLRKLEGRKVLEVRDIGYTNLVVLTDWFLER